MMQINKCSQIIHNLLPNKAKDARNKAKNKPMTDCSDISFNSGCDCTSGISSPFVEVC